MFFFKRKTSTDFRERRKEPRIPAKEDFLIEFKKKNFSGKPSIGNGRDISVHGIRFTSSFKLNKGDQLDVAVYLSQKFPGERKVVLKAKVVRVTKPGSLAQYRIGAELIHSEETTKEAIRNFMKWLEADASGQTKDITLAS
jgi:hypothetical protein